MNILLSNFSYGTYGRFSLPSIKFLTGEPLLVPLEQRVQCLRRIQAQQDRDQNRAKRLDPPIWEGVTMSFTSKVLDLSSLSQGSRSHYEKLLHERHWTVGHNSFTRHISLARSTLLLTAAPTTPMITSFVYAPILSCINAGQT